MTRWRNADTHGLSMWIQFLTFFTCKNPAMLTLDLQNFDRKIQTWKHHNLSDLSPLQAPSFRDRTEVWRRSQCPCANRLDPHRDTLSWSRLRHHCAPQRGQSGWANLFFNFFVGQLPLFFISFAHIKIEHKYIIFFLRKISSQNLCSFQKRKIDS